MDFSSGESFDDHHPPATLGARPEIAGTSAGDLLLGLRCRAEQLETKWQGGGTFAVGQEAEVPDAHEPFGEQMQQEAAQELIERERQQQLDSMQNLKNVRRRSSFFRAETGAIPPSFAVSTHFCER